MSDLIHKRTKPIVIPDEEPMVTPEWLERMGFGRVPHNCGEWNNLPFRIPANFDVDFQPDDFCYIEPEIYRDHFCVVLSPNEWVGGDSYYRFEIYVMDDIGCGFVNLPYRWTELSIKTFCLLFESFRGKKLLPANIIMPNRAPSASL